MKIRGTAQTVADKYAQLARDAQASGDPVSAENYFQHAEHYYRMIAAAQEQFRQQYGGTQRLDEDGEEGDEEGFGPQGQQPGNGMDEFGDGGGYPAPAYEPRGGDRPQQQRFDRNDQQPRFDRNDQQQPRYDRNDRPNNNNNNNRQQRFDRNDQQPRYDRNQDRPSGGGERFERPAGDRQDRRDRFPPRDGGNREFAPRDGQRDQRPEPRAEGEPPQQREARPEREPRPERQPRPEREPRPERPAYRPEPRFEERGAEMESPAANLPAFLTNPVRAPVATETGAGVEPDRSGETSPGGEPDTQAVRPRRRRVRKVDATETVGLDLANGGPDASE